MLKNVRGYYYPDNIAEAAGLHDREERSFFIAGGTGLSLSDSSRPVDLIDVSRLGLDKLKSDRESGKLFIGATTKIQSIVESKSVQSVFGGFLSESLEKVGSYPIRNAGTLGGSLVRPFPWSDIIPILSVLDTEVSYYHEGESGTRKISKLYKPDFRPTLNSSIIEEVSISTAEGEDTAVTFKKFSRSEFDVAALNLACRVTVDGDNVSKARLSIGARPMTARRVTDVEDSLIGEKLSEEVAKEAGIFAADTAGLGGDDKLSEEYRKQLVKKMTEESLLDIKKEIANES